LVTGNQAWSEGQLALTKIDSSIGTKQHFDCYIVSKIADNAASYGGNKKYPEIRAYQSSILNRQ